MRNPFKIGIALAALSLLTLGVIPASAQHGHDRSNRSRGRNDARVHRDFGRQDNHRSRRNDVHQHRDFRYESRGRSDHHHDVPRYRVRRDDHHHHPHHR